MTMQTLLIWLFGALVGSMLFFAIVVAPTVFRALPAENAGLFLRKLFPRYYLWGLIVALLCSLTALAAGVGYVPGGVCIAVLVMFIYARQVLMPAINRARDRDLEGDPQAQRQFKSLHLQSVAINALQMLMLIAATAYLVWV